MSDGKDNFQASPIDESSKVTDAEVVEQEIEPVRIGQIASMLDELSEPKKKKVQKKVKKNQKKKPESVFEIVEEKHQVEEYQVEKHQVEEHQVENVLKVVSEDKGESAEKQPDVKKESEKKSTADVKKVPKEVPEEKVKEATQEKTLEKSKTEAKETSSDEKTKIKDSKKKPGKKTAELIRMTALKGAEVSETFDEDEESDDDSEDLDSEDLDSEDLDSEDLDSEDLDEEAELRAEEEEVETQLERTRAWIREKVQKNRIFVLLTGIICLILAVYYLVHSQTYENISVISTETIPGAVNCYYTHFDEGFIKYSQDGLAYLSKNGDEKWNLAYQMADPFVEVNGKTGAVADKQGQSIVVFQKNGVIGQMETTLPIEKISVSKQGIVCAVLQNEDAAMVMVYDLVGKVLVEHKTAFSGTGYPMDIALSDNGENLMVTYLYVAEGIITTKVMFYNFGDAGRNISDHQIAEYDYPGTISATCFYMDKDICVMAGDDKLVYYRGTDEPEELRVIELDKEIKNLCYDNANVGLVLKNGKESGYEARMYDLDGGVKMSADFTGEYNHVKIMDDQILMYDGRRCSVVLKNGVQKFKGELENVVLEIVPEGGVNKYLLVDQDGFKRIRLVK